MDQHRLDQLFIGHIRRGETERRVRRSLLTKDVSGAGAHPAKELEQGSKTLYHDTLYHLGIDVRDRAAVIEAYHRARLFGASVANSPRTTWKGTPLHELWLEDPDGNLIEIRT